MKKFTFFLPFGACRGRCVYCHQETITGAASLPSPRDVRTALESLGEAAEVCFFGGSFCRFDHERVKEYLDAAMAAPFGSRVRFSTYPDDLRDLSLRRLIGSYPLACVELGIPSLDPAVLKNCRREGDPSLTLECLKTMADESIPLAVQMMIGLPGQTKESSLADLETLAAIKGPRDWELRLYPCLVIEGTELAAMSERGEYSPLSVEAAAEWGGEFLDRAISLGFRPIRVGLQESELLASQVRGGPHSPALGELIAAEAYARKFARGSKKGPWYILPRDLSKFTGHDSFGLRRLAFHSGVTLEAARELLKIF